MPRMSTSGSKPTLPIELVKAIIDLIGGASNIEEGLKEALQTCLLVSSLFRLFALPHVYKNISISIQHRTVKEFKTRIHSLAQVLNPPPLEGSRLPAVASYLDTVHLSFQETNGDLSASESSELGEYIIADEILVTLLRSLRREEYGIRVFTIDLLSGYPEARPLDSLGVHWKGFSSNFKAALQYLVRSPYLKYLELRNVYGLPLTILRGSHLKSLDISQAVSTWYFDPFPQPAPMDIEDLAYPALEEFSVSGLFPFDEVKYGSLLRNVKNILVSGEDMNRVINIIAIARQSVEHLRLEHYSQPDIYPQSFNLGLMPNLKAFTLNYSCTSHYYDIPNNDNGTAAGLYRLLNVDHPMLQFSNLHLDLTFFAHGVREDFFHPSGVLENNWHLIAEILSSPIYPALSHIKILLSFQLRSFGVGEVLFDTDKFKRTTSNLLTDCFRRLPGNVSVELSVKANVSG